MAAPDPTSRRQRWIRWPAGAGDSGGAQPRIAYGGDYNPEQWPEDVWAQDVELMQRAGVNLVTLSVFSWGLLEIGDGVFDFGWLDRILDRLHAGGIAVDLATATASPPAWLVTAHPEILPVDERGHTLGFGARQCWCPSSPVYRERSLQLVRAMAERYAEHPALALWHVSNELGGANVRCYCPRSAAAFRHWLAERYGTVDELNSAWGTAFWSQHYTDFEQIQPPRLAPTFANPTQQLDFARFSNDEVLGQFLAERDVLAEVTPDVPVTTNFMVMSHVKDMDYLQWGRLVDLVSNDHYLQESAAEPQLELAFSSDLTRGCAAGSPWMVMEQSTSAVNWGGVNRPKRPGELARNSMAQVARGADAVCYFQWRASRAGAEKFHSALLPHAGTETRLFTEVCALGADLAKLDELVGSTVSSQVAMLFDWPAWWAGELDSHPSQEFRYRELALALYEPFWRRHIGVDVVSVTTDLAGYRLLVVPALYLVDDATADRVAAFAAAGGTVLISYFSGIVDPSDHIRLGGYPGAFRELLGIRSEEFGPVRAGVPVHLDNDSVASRWTEDVQVVDASVVRRFADGPFPGGPAITRRALPAGGSSWYLATLPDPDPLGALVEQILHESGVEPPADAPTEVELVRRNHSDGRSYLFAINHGDTEATVRVSGVDLLSGVTAADDGLRLAPGAVAVCRET